MNRGLRCLQYGAFVSLGITQCIFGALLPAIRAELELSYSQAGLVLSGQFVGMVVSALFGGHLADRLGKKSFLLAASAFTVIGLSGCAISPSFLFLAAASALTGVGTGGYMVGVNSLEADHAPARSGHAMNLLHFFFGLGAIAGPLLVTFAARQGWSWRAALGGVALLPASVGGGLFFVRGPATRPEAVEDSSAVYGSWMLWVSAIAIAIYVGLETSMYGWIATFWQQHAQGSALPSPLLASLFWVLLTAGRLLSARLSEQVGLSRFLNFASMLVLAVALCWTFWPIPVVTLIVTGALGLCLAGIYPTTMALVTREFPGHSGKVVALLSLFTAMGGFFLPTAVGRLADTHGIRVLPQFLMGLSLALAVSLQVVGRRFSPDKAGC